MHWATAPIVRTRSGRVACDMLTLTLLPDRYAVCRLPPDAPVPAWFAPGPLSCLTHTRDELSLVVVQDGVPEEVLAERGWRVLRVEGPLDFGLTGVLASIAGPLAHAGVPIFVVSTYDTDFVLVPGDKLGAARRALEVGFELGAGWGG